MCWYKNVALHAGDFSIALVVPSGEQAAEEVAQIGETARQGNLRGEGEGGGEL